MILWQYNEDKTLDWLTPKVEKVSKVLKSQQINVNPNVAISSSFKLSDTNTQSSEGNFLISVWLYCNIIETIKTRVFNS